MSVKVTGLDLSMTCTGVVFSGLSGVAVIDRIRPVRPGDLRLPEIASAAAEYTRGAKLVLIEGYLNHSHSAGITGMVHGVVRAALIEQGIRYGTFPPTSLKKYATGRGGASKADMRVAAMKRAGLEFKDDNECDAWWLWVAANDHLDQQVLALPQAQRDALAAIKMEV